MRTTLDLPDRVFRELKASAAKQGLNAEELVVRLIEAGLANAPQPASKTRSPLPPPRPASGRVIEAMSNAQMQSILDNQDLARRRSTKP